MGTSIIDLPDIPNINLNNYANGNFTNQKISQLKELINKIIKGITTNYNQSVIIINKDINKNSIPLFGSIIECFSNKLQINIPIASTIAWILYQRVLDKDANYLENNKIFKYTYFDSLIEKLKSSNCIDNNSINDYNNLLISINTNDLNNLYIFQNKIQSIINIFNNFNYNLCNDNNPQIIIAKYFLYISILLSLNKYSNTFDGFIKIKSIYPSININFVPNNIKIINKELQLFNLNKRSSIGKLETGFCFYSIYGINYIIKLLLGNVSKINISFTSSQNITSIKENPNKLSITCSLFNSPSIEPKPTNLKPNQQAQLFNFNTDIEINNLNSIPRMGTITTNLLNGVFNHNIKGEIRPFDFNNIYILPQNNQNFNIKIGDNNTDSISIKSINIYKSSIKNKILQPYQQQTSSNYINLYSQSINLEPGFIDSSFNISFNFKNNKISFNIAKIIQYSLLNNNLIINNISFYLIPSLSPFYYQVLPNNQAQILFNNNTFQLDTFIQNIDNFTSNSRLSQEDKIYLIKSIIFILSHFDKFVNII
jgi:hypothetical protein